MGVEGMACLLATRWGLAPEPVLLAALLHDLFKQEPGDTLLKHISEGPFTLSEEDEAHPQLWHGVAAASWAVNELEMHDEDVLQAVAHHTTGNSGLSSVGLVLFIADYIEPGRGCIGVPELRRAVLAAESPEMGARAVAVEKIDVIRRQRKKLHSRTLRMAEWLESLTWPMEAATMEEKE